MFLYDDEGIFLNTSFLVSWKLNLWKLTEFDHILFIHLKSIDFSKYSFECGEEMFFWSLTMRIFNWGWGQMFLISGCWPTNLIIKIRLSHLLAPFWSKVNGWYWLSLIFYRCVYSLSWIYRFLILIVAIIVFSSASDQ